MDNREAIERLKDMESESICHAIHYYTDKDIPMFQTAIRAIEELEQYRELGTVEEITDIFALCKILQGTVKQYAEVGTLEQVREAVEKMKPYKPKEYEDRYYACKCENILLPKWRKYPTELMPKSEGLPHCMACGQKLDWSVEE